jgi:hypothetical protein
MKDVLKTILLNYNKWLYDCGYTDADIYSELEINDYINDDESKTKEILSCVKLISSAPDLLEASKKVIKHFDMLFEKSDTLKLLKDAVNKAEGRNE